MSGLFKNEDNSKPIYLLSIDGGGIKGLIALRILRRIEEILKIDIYETFQAYSGTSTGSIILGTLVYNKQTAGYIESNVFNKEVARRIMHESFIDEILDTFQTMPKYSGKPKRDAINNMLDGKIMTDTDKEIMFSSYNVSKNQDKFFKSYDDCKYTVTDAIDASSAAPSYFPAVAVNKEVFIDGSGVANNPCDCL